MTHTPGPWWVNESQGRIDILGEHGGYVAEVIDGLAGTRANASLIVSATGLLAALEWLHPKPGVWRTPPDDKAAEIERIIATAKGQT